MHSLQIDMCNKCYCTSDPTHTYTHEHVYLFIGIHQHTQQPNHLQILYEEPISQLYIFRSLPLFPSLSPLRNLVFSLPWGEKPSLPTTTLRQRQQLAEKDKQLQKASTSHLEGALVRRIHHHPPSPPPLWDMEKDGDMDGDGLKSVKGNCMI